MPGEVTFIGPFIPTQGSDLISEDLSNQIDGTRVLFTTSAEFQDIRLFVFLNGLFQGPAGGSDIQVNSTTTFTISMTPLTGDSITVIYSPQIKT